jgi:hypothetical protein
LGRKQVRTELLVTREDKLMTIATPARPAPSADHVETTSAPFDATPKSVLRARWQRDVDGALVCQWVAERATPTVGQSRA